MKFIALQANQIFGIKKGQIFEIDDNEIDLGMNKIFLDTEMFEEWIDETERIHKGDFITFSGYWWNKSHPTKNRLNIPNRMEKMNGTIIEISSITTNNNPHSKAWNIEICGSDGNTYYTRINTLNKTKLENGMNIIDTYSGKTHLCHIAKISYNEMYWFINSDGKACSDIKGRKPQREQWLKASHNFWSTSDEANQYKTKILCGM